MAISRSCDLTDHASKKQCPADAGEIVEREYEHDGKIYGMDQCDMGDVTTLTLIRESREKFEAEVAKLRAKMNDSILKVLTPAIAQGRVWDVPQAEPEEQEVTTEDLTGKYGTALDLAMKSFYSAEYSDKEQPNPNRKKVAQKFHQLFFAKEDAWEEWKVGDPIPEGWVYDGKTCERTPVEDSTQAA